jgi:hypothetical protein
MNDVANEPSTENLERVGDQESRLEVIERVGYVAAGEGRGSSTDFAEAGQ